MVQEVARSNCWFLRGIRKLRRNKTYKTPATKPLSLVQRIANCQVDFQHTMKTTNNLGIALTLFCIICGVLGGRRYIAIPVDSIDGIDVIEVSPIAQSLSRVARQTEAYIPGVAHHQDDAECFERSATRILDYVDFGGHTGSNGAFSWYADYPVHRL